MKQTTVSLLTVLAMVGFVSLAIWWNVSLWNECRQTNSFWYCVRILGK